MIRLEVERQTLQYFSFAIENGSARRLELLRAIDGTIAWLDHITSQIQADATFAEKLTEEVMNLAGQIDEEGELLETFDKAQTSVGGLYSTLIGKRRSAQEDPRLIEDDGIEFAYDEVIAAVADLHNNLNTLRWAIAEHDADLSPVSKPYNNVEKLLGELEA